MSDVDRTFEKSTTNERRMWDLYLTLCEAGFVSVGSMSDNGGGSDTSPNALRRRYRTAGSGATFTSFSMA